MLKHRRTIENTSDWLCALAAQIQTIDALPGRAFIPAELSESMKSFAVGALRWRLELDYQSKEASTDN